MGGPSPAQADPDLVGRTSGGERPIAEFVGELADRDQEAQGSVLGSAVALRIFLFLVPASVVIVSLIVLLDVTSLFDGDQLEKGYTTKDIFSALEDVSGWNALWLLLSGLVLTAWAGRSLAKVLAACSAAAWRMPAVAGEGQGRGRARAHRHRVRRGGRLHHRRRHPRPRGSAGVGAVVGHPGRHHRGGLVLRAAHAPARRERPGCPAPRRLRRRRGAGLGAGGAPRPTPRAGSRAPSTPTATSPSPSPSSATSSSSGGS